MVEPQSWVFDQLIHSSREPGIAFEMAAIGDQDGTKTLYEISFSKGQWATALASFDYDVIKKHIENGYIASCAREEGVVLPLRIEDYCTRESVQCLRLQSLLKKHNLLSLDILLIDTEGYDYEIVRQIHRLEAPPRVVIFEHKHLTRFRYQSCINVLRSLKYELHADSCNCIALRHNHT